MKIKRILCTVLVLLVLLTGCAAKQAEEKKTRMEQEVEAQMELPMTVQEVLEDISEVDFFYQLPDTSAYRQETVDEPETDTQRILYYEDDRLVFVRYIGYGEDTFDCYTQSKSGNDLVVRYIDQDGARYGVMIEAEKYSFAADNLKKGKAPAAYQVTICRTDSDRLPETAVYAMENNTIYLSQAQYYDAEGNVCSYGSCLNEGEIEEWNDIRYPLDPDAQVSPELTEILKRGGYDRVEVMLGAHRLSFNSRNQWYLTGTFAFVFEEKEAAEDLAEACQLEVTEGDAGGFYVELCDVTAALAADFRYRDADIFSFAQDEFNDPFYRPVDIQADGSITGIF